MRYLPIIAVDSVHDRHIKWCMVDIGFYLCTLEMNNGTSLTQEHLISLRTASIIL